MNENKIELKSISELFEKNFFIPSYQRGYRWTKQQVKDLLDDIQEFIDKNRSDFYCIQPLVVKRSIPEANINSFKDELEKIKKSDNNNSLVDDIEKLIRNKTRWEVIDGQQRLTTIHILLSYLQENTKKYAIEYQTRTDSRIFLKNVDESKKEDNIDYYHIVEAKNQIKSWFEKNKFDETKFRETLLHKVQFIWYESVGEDPIKVFTRLNVGKISLTNAELIKALFLNKSNFQGSDNRKQLQQNEIALEWDNIEYTLQNDEFWLFLHNDNYNKPTRIDFIFDLICDKDILKVKEILKKKNDWEKLNLTDKEINEKYKSELGKDEHKTFRYFYFWFKENPTNITKCWEEVKKFFQIFQEWYNDLKLYHYIGYLLSEVGAVGKTPISNLRISDIIEKWEKSETTQSFIDNFLVIEIKKTLSNCKDLNKQYEIDGNPKTQCRPILLLHNIQTVINQNQILIDNEKYKLPVFYKFPFHLFKKEKWDVEHIDSNTENDLEDENNQKEWLLSSYVGVEESLQEQIKKFCFKKEGVFEDLRKKIQSVSSFNTKLEEDKKVAGTDEVINEKNMLWNFTLLDESTNRSYGNAIFSAKRRVVIGKTKGEKYEIKFNKDEDKIEIITKQTKSAFIPPCTEKVFQKSFIPLPSSLREWDKNDANEYKKNIEETLQEIFKIGEKKDEQQ